MKKKKPARPAKSAPIELPARLTIAQSVELHRTFAKALAGGVRVYVDGSRVEEVDTAILQLLTSAWLDAAKVGVECRWQGASAVLRDTAKLIGVADKLHFDQAA